MTAKLRSLLAEEGLLREAASDKSTLDWAGKEIAAALEKLEGVVMTLEDRSEGESLADVYREAAETVNILRRSSGAIAKAASSLGRIRTAAYSGNPDGKPIYPNEIDHGYDKPISGGSDVMVELVEDLRHEQGQ